MSVLEKNFLECSGVRFTPEDGRIARRVPRMEVKKIELGYGFQAARPKIQACVGVLLMAVGVWAAWDLVYRLDQGNTIRPYYYAMLMACMVFGAWLLRDSARRGHFLLVTTQSSWEKLPFHSKTDSSEIDRFLKDASTKFGYFFATTLVQHTPVTYSRRREDES